MSKKSNLTFQQDNASCHVSKDAKAYFSRKNINILDWPANSPDLNPIENLWAILKYNVAKRTPINKKQLISFILEEWDKIPMQIIHNLFDSMAIDLNKF